MFYRFLVTLLFVLLFAANSIGQTKAKRHHEKLRLIRKEILGVEKEIEASKKKETSVLYLLNNLDLDIDLAQSVVKDIKNEQKEKTQQIKKTEKKLTESEKELENLKQLLSKRLVYTYKYGRVKDVELLLTARSVNDGLLWVEYQKRLSEHAFRNYVKIKDKKAQIARDKDLLTVELSEQKELLKEKIEEENKLKKKKKERQKVLAKIRENRDLLRQQLAEKEKAADEIKQLIVRLATQPKQKPMVKPDTPFANLKGRMIWPTQGEVVTKFGKYKHPELKTVTENIGIDIKAPLGSAVQAVANGTVTVITWQRGLGNIIIVRHYGGYFSAYGHLKEINVDENQEVQMGQVIGNVGESGSIKGPILHFQIWKGTEKVDPELWLGKST